MGLFFISEIAKLTGGKLLLASREAALFLRGDPEGLGQHRLTPIRPPGTGYPGTLLAFEVPLRSVGDFDGLIAKVHELAKARTPQRASHRWLTYGRGPEGVQRMLVPVGTENTAEAIAYAQTHLLPRIARREPIALDFTGMDLCTQSFVHALLYEALRVAWALHVPIYITNARPAVRSTIELLENYALRG